MLNFADDPASTQRGCQNTPASPQPVPSQDSPAQPEKAMSAACWHGHIKQTQHTAACTALIRPSRSPLINIVLCHLYCFKLHLNSPISAFTCGSSFVGSVFWKRLLTSPHQRWLKLLQESLADRQESPTAHPASWQELLQCPLPVLRPGPTLIPTCSSNLVPPSCWISPPIATPSAPWMLCLLPSNF